MAGLAWLLLRSRRAPTSPGSGSAALQAAPPPPRAADPVDAAPAPGVANDNLPFRDPGPTDSHDGPVHPHPITPERMRIQEENQLLGAMNDAMDLGDGPGLRKILNDYRAQFPEDPNQLQAGYQIIADCLEHPGAAARAAGRRYYDLERGSILRLFVGRHCLDLR